MGLNAALVDRARVIQKRAAGRVVDGETIYSDTEGEWFKCRLQIGRDAKADEPATQAAESVHTPELLYAFRDLAGEPVVLNVQQRLEVASRQLGDATYEVQADPEPLRKKRRVIGYQTTLRRVEQHGNPG